MKQVKIDVVREDDPLGLMKGVNDYNICQDCGKKIDKKFNRCYNCHVKFKEEQNGLK